MIDRVLAVAAVLLASACASAQSTASLTETDPPGDPPRRFAELTIRNGTDRPAGGLAIRAAAGGPMMLHPLILPTGAETTVTVDLPVSGPEQLFLVRLLADPDDPDSAMDELDVTIKWSPAAPADLLIDPSIYEAYASASPTWSPSDRLVILLGMAAMIVLAAAALLIRRKKLGLAVVAGIATVAIVAAACLVLMQLPRLVLAQTVGEDPRQTYLIVSAYRTTVWRTDRTDLRPVYPDDTALLADGTIIRPGRMSIPLEAGEVRLLQIVPRGPQPPTGP